MNAPARPWSKLWRLARWAGLAAAAPALWACSSRTLDETTACSSTVATFNYAQKINNELDLLFMVDNSSSMTSMQQKLLAQLPNFMNRLESLPVKPSLHVAVVSSDMGAPGDSTASITCTQSGDQGQFQSAPRGACTATTLTAGDTFISDADGIQNFTDPIASVFQCIGLLGDTGCGFEHQLASIDRALGADGLGPAPAQNANFLRPEAYLGIIMLTNEDDCSAPADTTIYSLNGAPQSITNPDGPIANYRCNGGPRGGHLCKDKNPGSANTGYATPPLFAPSDAGGTPAMLQLSDCEDNESGTSALTPVSKFIEDVRALKPDPDDQIFVGAIIGPAAPYGVEWVPGAGAQSQGELWPQVMHSCGSAGGDDVNPAATMLTSDGSFGDPGVREVEFAAGFPASVVASICDDDYSRSMTAIATAIGQLITPPCITGNIANDAQGKPACSVIEKETDSTGTITERTIPNCQENGDVAPCWTLLAGTGTCSGLSLNIVDPTNMMTVSAYETISCAMAGSQQIANPGCPAP